MFNNIPNFKRKPEPRLQFLEEAYDKAYKGNGFIIIDSVEVQEVDSNYSYVEFVKTVRGVLGWFPVLKEKPSPPLFTVITDKMKFINSYRASMLKSIGLTSFSKEEVFYKMKVLDKVLYNRRGSDELHRLYLKEVRARNSAIKNSEFVGACPVHILGKPRWINENERPLKASFDFSLTFNERQSTSHQESRFINKLHHALLYQDDLRFVREEY